MNVICCNVTAILWNTSVLMPWCLEVRGALALHWEGTDKGFLPCIVCVYKYIIYNHSRQDLGSMDTCSAVCISFIKLFIFGFRQKNKLELICLDWGMMLAPAICWKLFIKILIKCCRRIVKWIRSVLKGGHIILCSQGMSLCLMEVCCLKS